MNIGTLKNYAPEYAARLTFDNSTTSDSTRMMSRSRGVQVQKTATLDANVTLTFQVSDDNSTWYTLQDALGNDVVVTVAAAGNVAIVASAETWAIGGWEYMRLTSSAIPVAGGQAVFTVKALS